MGAELAEIEALYRASYVGYRNALATVTGSYESARDAVQQAFAQAIAERAAFRGQAPLGAWVWKIALRQALAFREDFATAELNGAFDPRLVEPANDPMLSGAARAPAARRLVVFLHYFADLSYPEIAEVVGISEGTVAATLNQARASLRDAMTEGVTSGGS